ncbi:conserved hypothetical protein [Roseovarius sp. EC-HK134]|uniref:hypothetical protein n=1 Tax=unclassified Roseovarius TaxID=2614913 RepID=UPI00125A2D5B|nr:MULTISPECIES: hypothetical protein [unclassified Roseovarius]VVT31759.1 conserved hypothetical protein [Roseovarius sp. EC-HK134]VVT32330.1 conserved hypothetical protein [Roseovarius sp. EC-SD190]
MPEQKKKIGRPKTDTKPVMIRMEPEMISEIDAYRRTLDDVPTRPEAMRRILADFLEAWRDGRD